MSAVVVERPAVPPQKHESTLIARFALCGHAVHKLESGGYLVVWRNCSRHCGDLESLEAFARQVGAIRVEQGVPALRSAPAEGRHGS